MNYSHITEKAWNDVMLEKEHEICRSVSGAAWQKVWMHLRNPVNEKVWVQIWGVARNEIEAELECRSE